MKKTSTFISNSADSFVIPRYGKRSAVRNNISIGHGAHRVHIQRQGIARKAG